MGFNAVTCVCRSADPLRVKLSVQMTLISRSLLFSPGDPHRQEPEHLSRSPEHPEQVPVAFRSALHALSVSLRRALSVSSTPRVAPWRTSPSLHHSSGSMTLPRRRRVQSRPCFSALWSLSLGLERSPGSITTTTPARSLAWPSTAPCTRRDCTQFLRNIPALYGMWLITLLLLYSFKEGE